MARWIIASALLLGLAVPGAAQDDIAPDENLPSDLVEMRRDRNARMTVPVTIDGQGPFRFLIDTGAQSTVVTQHIVDTLSLVQSGTATLVGMGSSAQVRTYELDGLEFADREFNGMVAPLLESKNIGADGILGLDSLQDLRVLIDFREDRMSVSDAASVGSNNGYEIIVRARRKLGQMIITNAIIDGVRTAIIIDTGAEHSLGNLALQKRLRSRNNTELISSDVHGFVMTSEMSVARSLQIGKLTITGVPIGFADGPAFAALGLAKKPALILGMRNLRLLDRVAIDFAKRRVMFDLPSGSMRDQRTGRLDDSRL
ncbi:retroviral-like aspartic protease family protein [Qipengyuania marisflavi]|uniref:Peptidase A2 domain-containing protein n=1 Tax=Qipengyuania marisflavi TaxID=2486356 RepID=A0A5S3NY61_9SPHN|nr:retroviral-like aspartic protease family protein [Qipengyuania marisflavi]TMM45322.1 hypothetical protein FEV51_12650 [Qipengyuania marisflavi]